MQTTFFSWKNNILVLHVLIQPGASNDEIVGLQDERLKIRLKAIPLDGKANQSLIQFLAKTFKLPKNAISLIKGQTSRQKTVSIKSLLKIPAQVLKFSSPA